MPYNFRTIFLGRLFLSYIVDLESFIVWAVIAQWRSQNAQKVTHIKGRLLYQALIDYNYVPFQIGTS